MGRINFTIFVLTSVFCIILVNGKPQVPCYFIFGDGLSDAGNNNNLITTAKANYPPYGVDFPGAIPTGRFTNGFTTPDFLNQYLGFSSPKKPSNSNNLTIQDILEGVNFASSGAGILEESGAQLGDRIWFNRQIVNYGRHIIKLQLLVKGPVANYLNKCLFTVNIGSSDYVFNYFRPENNLPRKLFNPYQFADKLVARYKANLQALYNTGARKFALFGLGRLGCLYGVRITYNATGCVEEINQAVEPFNQRLAAVVKEFNSNLQGAKLTFVNTTSIQDLNVIPTAIITNSTCCKLRSDFQCEPFTAPCANRSNYLFFDGLRRSQIVYRFSSAIVYNTTNPLFVHPMNISRLAAS